MSSLRRAFLGPVPRECSLERAPLMRADLEREAELRSRQEQIAIERVRDLRLDACVACRLF